MIPMVLWIRARDKEKAEELLPKNYALDHRLLRKFGRGDRHFYWYSKEVKNVKQVWHIKFIYNSPRGPSHDFLVEVEVIAITKNGLSKKDIIEIANNRRLRAVMEEDIPDIYNKIEAGLVEEEETDEEEKIEAEVTKYSHTLT